MNRTAAIIVIIMMMMSSCRLRHNEYSYYHSFDSAGWAYGDSLKFSPEIDDSICTGVLAVCLRHTNAYPYSNLWLELQYAVDDSTTARDTLQIQLADEFGRWHGKGSGVSLQLADTVRRDFKLLNGKPMQLRHIMRADTLREIEQIGVSFTPL